MYKLEIKLKQHTPLIHFQHDQKGATLRATEVKPKLDKFIIEKLLKEKGIKYNYKGEKKFITERDAFADNAQKYGWDTWLIGKGKNEHVALDYKMRIIAEGKPEYYLITSYLSKRDLSSPLLEEYNIINNAPYFAQEKEIKDYLTGSRKDFSKLGVVNKNNIIQIHTINGELSGLIGKYFKPFLAVENFGCRQNKGFGSYYIDDNDDFESVLKKERSNSCRFSFKNREDDFQNVFKNINIEYKILKSGYNDTESKLKECFEEKGILWEKLAVYNHINEYESNGEQEFQYIRAFLGLAELFEFTKHEPTFKVLVQHYSEDKNYTITRFKSPITYKVYKGSIYLYFDEIPREIMGQKFKFTFESDSEFNFEPSLIIETPKVHDNFMNELIKRVCENKWKKL